MFLLRTNGQQRLCELNDPPPYAILSHRWRKEEVLYRDIKMYDDIKKADESLMALSGYQKIMAACRQASRDGLDYIWIDTCCIDRDNNTIFSEALNSMHPWYQNARVCYAYLDDVNSDEDSRGQDTTFEESQWFRRGWTLQELLAPETVLFFAKDWTLIGSKVNLADKISDITGVRTDVLLFPERIRSYSVATRMSWASGRETLKDEDRVYSLMGIFGVRMPIIYGEGAKEAMFRLQQEIIKVSNDQSIFAWRTPTFPSPDDAFGALADSPDRFTDPSIHCIPPGQWYKHCTKHYNGSAKPRLGFCITNDGLNITLPLRRLNSCNLSHHLNQGAHFFEALLGCTLGHHPVSRLEVNIDSANLVRTYLQQPDPDIPLYIRVPDSVVTTPDRSAQDFTLQDIYVMPTTHDSGGIFFTPYFIVQSVGIKEAGFTVEDPEEEFCNVDKHDDTIRLRLYRPIQRQEELLIAHIQFKSDDECFTVTLGAALDCDRGAGPWVNIYEGHPKRDKEVAAGLRMDWATLKLTMHVVIVSVREEYRIPPRYRGDSLQVAYRVVVMAKDYRHKGFITHDIPGRHDPVLYMSHRLPVPRL